MAAVEVTITGVLYDKLARTTQQVALIGECFLTNVGIGGGPIIPPAGPPIIPPGDLPHPEHPIVIPPNVPPGLQPPAPPNPGDPTTAVPGNWPVSPMVPPPYIVVNYPGIGPVVVAPPAAPTS